MNGKCARHMAKVSFYKLYRKVYAPALMAVDILLKTMERPLSVKEAAQTLGLTESALRAAMAREKVVQLDQKGLLAVLAYGGGVFSLLKRELARGVKGAYRPSDIAYIYGLNEPAVRKAYRQLGIKEAPAQLVPALLKQIPVFILY